MLGVSTGGRISELLSLTIGDVWQNRAAVTDLLYDKSIVKGGRDPPCRYLTKGKIMFLENLKRHYWLCCFFAAGLCLSRIIENILTFDALRLLVNVFMVLAGAFILYCLAYPFIAIFRHFQRKALNGGNQ